MYKLHPAPPGETVPPDVVTVNEATPAGTSIFLYCGVMSLPLIVSVLPLNNHNVESDTKFALNERLALPTVKAKLAEVLRSFPFDESVQFTNLYMLPSAVATTVQDCPVEYVPPPEVVPIYDGSADVVMVTP